MINCDDIFAEKLVSVLQRGVLVQNSANLPSLAPSDAMDFCQLVHYGLEQMRQIEAPR